MYGMILTPGQWVLRKKHRDGTVGDGKPGFDRVG
jgi:hypothetical protein